MYTNIQQDQKEKLDDRMSMLFAYLAGGEGVGGLEVVLDEILNLIGSVSEGFSSYSLKCFVRRGQIFFYLLCVWGGISSVLLLP